MAWTSNDLAAMEANIASGTLLVRFADGREVRYQTLADLLKAYEVMKASVAAQAAAASPSAWPSRRRLARFSSGLASSDSYQ